MDLKDTFKELFLRYTSDEDSIDQYWSFLEKSYTSKSRYYHNLDHLENLLADFNQLNDSTETADAILFAIFYHDIVCVAGRSDNESKSAQIFLDVIEKTNFNQAALVQEMILASKSHLPSGDKIINVFLDLDLGILGYPSEQYLEYAENIRKEYSHLPLLIFKMGRKKFINKKLNQKTIFITTHFFEKYEIQARKNMLDEYVKIS